MSLAVPRASAYALLGRPGAGKTTLLHCILGTRRPSEGSVSVLGRPPREARQQVVLVGGERRTLWGRLAARGSAAQTADRLLERALSRRPELLLLDQPRFEEPDRARQRLEGEVASGMTACLATSDPRQAEGFAGWVGILEKGRLVANEELASLLRRFRRIRYINQITETRRDYGNELDEFNAVRVKARGWGVDAIVSNFDEAAFERFRRLDGVEEARVKPLSLAEIFENLQ